MSERTHGTDLIFEPYALQQFWSASRPFEPGEWVGLFGEYLIRLAAACTDAGAAVIGHIKLLALFDDHAYLRVSAVSATHPPTVTGAVPAAQTAVAVTLNVLIYGLGAGELAGLVSTTAAEVAGGRGLIYREEAANASHAAHTEGTDHAH